MRFHRLTLAVLASTCHVDGFTQVARQAVVAKPGQFSERVTRQSQAAPRGTRRRRRRPPTRLAIAVDDIIFSAQSIGSDLANSVIPSPGSAAGGSATAAESVRSLAVLYAAGLWTSLSPCSLGLLPITVSYISSAARERVDGNTSLPALAFAAGLASVFTALGVSASALGGVFGGTGAGGGGETTVASLLLAAVSSLVSVSMGLQLLDLISIPLPSLDDRFRPKNLAGSNKGSLFDENGGLVMDSSQERSSDEDQGQEGGDEIGSLFRTFLLGGTSALVASPCATPVLASLLAYLASASSDSASLAKGASWMLVYTLGYSTPLLAVGATGGQALVNLQSAKREGLGAALGQWVTPLTGGVLIAFGMNGFLVALLGDPSLAGLAPIIE